MRPFCPGFPGVLAPCLLDGRMLADGWLVKNGLIGLDPVSAEYPATLCDLRIFADQASELVPPQDPGIRVHNGRTLTPSGRALAERPVRAMNVIVLDVLTQDQPQEPLAGDQHPVQALAPERREVSES